MQVQWRLLLLEIAIIGFGICAPVQTSAQTHVKIGIVSPTFGHAPFYVAREKGFFRAEGLVGEVIVMNRDDLILRPWWRTRFNLATRLLPRYCSPESRG